MNLKNLHLTKSNWNGELDEEPYIEGEDAESLLS